MSGALPPHDTAPADPAEESGPPAEEASVSSPETTPSDQARLSRDNVASPAPGAGTERLEPDVEPDPHPRLEPLLDSDPRSVGAYRIAGRLGTGGMGVVYGALDEHDRRVAVKVVHLERATDPEHRAGLVRDLELLRRVRGVCVATVRAADPNAAVPWIVSDYVPGSNLAEHVGESGPLAGKTLTAFAAGLAEALSALHSAGIVHRDLEPKDVILSPDGPKLVNAGVTAIDSPNAQAASQGAPGWVAPERHVGAPATGYSDVFAWGAIVAFAATGHHPFGHGAPEEIRDRVSQEEPDLEGVPEELLPLVREALARTPPERPHADRILRTVLVRSMGVSDDPERPIEAFAADLTDLLNRHWRGVARPDDPAPWIAAVERGVPSVVDGTRGTAVASSPGLSGRARIGWPRGSRARVLTVVLASVLIGAVLGTVAFLAARALPGPAGPGPAAPESSPAVEASAEPDPDVLAAQEEVAETVDLVLAADSFDAELRSEGDAGTTTIRYQFTSDPEPTYVQSASRIGPEGYVRTAGDDLLAYDPDSGEWTRDPQEAAPELADFYASVSPEGFVAPLRAMAEAGDLRVRERENVDGIDTVLYDGNIELEEIVGVEADTAPTVEVVSAYFQLRTDEDGYPIRLYYGEGPNETRIEFHSFNEPVALGAPWDRLPADPDTIPTAETP